MKNEYLMILIYMYSKYTNYIAVRKERDEARGTTRKAKEPGRQHQALLQHFTGFLCRDEILQPAVGIRTGLSRGLRWFFSVY